MKNILLIPFSLPPFSFITPKDVVPAIKSVLSDCSTAVEHIIAQEKPFTWQNLCQPLAELDDHLSRIWSSIDHLNAVRNSPELRSAYEQALPLLSKYSTAMGQHKGLYQAYCNLKEGVYFNQLSLSQKKSVENTLRDFKLSGIDLALDQQQRYGEIVARLSELNFTYSNNVLDATMGWSKLITEPLTLSGIPISILSQAQLMAQSKNKIGWLLTLDMPSYLPILTYADNRALREEIYFAFSTRASDQGPHAGKWDNSEVMAEILTLRYELATLLGFKTYANKSLVTKMAESPEIVINFLNDLTKRARPQAEKEIAQLRTFARKYHNIDNLEAWDIAYYSEKQKQHLFSISEEKLRQYFPEPRVFKGLFELLKRIYGITIKERSGVNAWHSDVRFLDVFNANGEICGSFYIDLYVRENKRDGAWMHSCIDSLRKSNGTLQKPVAYITCNFNRPIGKNTALFTHNEVITLFHEFGHGLHHIMTEIDTSGVSGINGVPWDAVELPSQFMENWCWEPAVLAFLSGHCQSGEQLPKDILDKLVDTKNYQAALFILRQLELSLFDLLLHFECQDTNNMKILQTLAKVKKKVSILPSPHWVRFPHSFSHIFSGGYAAGYYSYLWAAVLSSDAYSRFEEEGIFNAKVGRSFLNNILARGGSEEPIVLFKRFRGRAPKLDAMLRHYGITE